MAITNLVRSFSVAVLLGNGLMAYADTLGAVMWGGPTQAKVVCTFFNGGSGTVDIQSLGIYGGNGVPANIAVNTCGANLAPFKTCYFFANVPVSGTNACNVILSPSGADIRGEMQVQNASGVVINSGPIR
jgi:hypothetical protein